jgi:putative addiction module CopG family antidote
MTITLPPEMAQAVKNRVASGDYASESEVVREGLRALAAQERGVELWLAREGVARFNAYLAAPDQTFDAETTAAKIEAHMARGPGRDEP